MGAPAKGRPRARKRAIDLLFESDQRALNRTRTDEYGYVSGPHLDEVIIEVLRERLIEPGHEVALPEYAVDLVQGVSSELGQIDEYLATYSHGWTLQRMPAVDRAILRLGVWELVFNDDIPDNVAIDEAISLAAQLSTDDSPKFVNGLLSRVKEMKT